ncbi:type IV pilus modification PilV family protein [Pseudaeromonas pectinilytica]
MAIANLIIRRRHPVVRGFALLEIMIAMLVGAVALLGLGTLQLKTLQSAYSSLDYTIATIHANNLIEGVWSNLCANRVSGAVYTSTVESWRHTLPPSVSATVATSYSDSAVYNLTWNDARQSDNNSLSLRVTYPAICP